MEKRSLQSVIPFPATKKTDIFPEDREERVIIGRYSQDVHKDELDEIKHKPFFLIWRSLLLFIRRAPHHYRNLCGETHPGEEDQVS
jgi:hypothetical protein